LETVSPTESSPSESSNLLRPASAIPISCLKARSRNYAGICTQTNKQNAGVSLGTANQCAADTAQNTSSNRARRPLSACSSTISGRTAEKAPAIDDRGKLAERLEVRIRPFPCQKRTYAPQQKHRYSITWSARASSAAERPCRAYQLRLHSRHEIDVGQFLDRKRRVIPIRGAPADRPSV